MITFVRMKPIYLDNAATTPLHNEVITTIADTLTHIFGNPSSTHQFGRKAKVVVEEARKFIANQFNVTPGEVIFTSGGSEADNLILRNAVTGLGVKHIITSAIEHHAVLHTVQALEKEFDVKVSHIRLNEKGVVKLEHVAELLAQSQDKTMVSLMHINNEIGNILDLKSIAALCNKYNALFHSDTVQTIGHYPLDLQETPVDFITASAHKFHGPKGVGFAIINKEYSVTPLLIGGEQERGTRAGTENVHSIAGLHKAISMAYNNLNEDSTYIRELKNYFIKGLRKLSSDIQFNGCSEDDKQSSYIILNVRFPREISMLLFNLDLKGIAASGGSACQSGSTKGSHVLQAILPEEELKNTSVRFSFSKYLTKADMDYTLEVLKELI